MDLPVFFWCRNFGFGNFRAEALSWEQRLVLLADAVHSIAARVRPLEEPVRVEGATLQPLAIFLAPEYLFRPMVLNEDANSLRAEAYSDEIKHRIVRALCDLSNRYPHILIFAGTVVWKKDIQLTGGALHEEDMFYEPVSDFSQLEETAQRRREKYAERIEQWKRQRKPSDRKVYRDKFDVANVQGWNQAQTPGQKREALLSPALKEIVKNTGFVCLGGRVVLKYSKQNDFHEVLQDDSIQFVPGMECPTIDVWGRTLAMMICADYNNRDIKTFAGTKANIWVILSDVLTVSELPPTGTKSGFAALLAISGDEKSCALRVRSKSKVSDVVLDMAGDAMLMGVLSLP